MLELARKTHAHYKPPSNKNDSRTRSYETILEERINDVDVNLDAALQKSVTCGATITSDGATVHKRPLTNYVLTAPCWNGCSMLLELTDSTGDIQDGELRGADAYATHTVSLIRTTPEGGRCVVLMVGDTAGDQMLAAKMVERVLPWLSWQCCVCHTINRILSAIGNIEAVKTLMAEVGSQPVHCLAICHRTT